MPPAAAVPLPGATVAKRSAAQLRILTTALALFGEYGVSGTSLQMIADAIGVTKAAVYHQFKTKDEIVVAVAEVELVRLEAAIAAAEAEPDRPLAKEVLLREVINVAVERRQLVSRLQTDPVIVRLLAEHEPFERLMERLYRVLIDDDAVETRVGAAMLSAAIGGAVIHPLILDLDDDTLRTQLLHFARRFITAP